MITNKREAIRKGGLDMREFVVLIGSLLSVRDVLRLPYNVNEQFVTR